MICYKMENPYYIKNDKWGIEPSRDIIDKMEENKLKGHVGQMGGIFVI